MFVVSYLAFSVPALVAGIAVTEVGLRDTAEVYGAALIAIAAIALMLSLRPARSPSGGMARAGDGLGRGLSAPGVLVVQRIRVNR